MMKRFLFGAVHAAALGIMPLVVLTFVGGCAMQPPLALVNDISVQSAFDSGYLVTAVDGKPVKRTSSKDRTAAPMVQVPPGQHTFTLQRKNNSAGETTFRAEVQPGKEYRIDVGPDGGCTLVDTRRLTEPAKPKVMFDASVPSEKRS
jgi:hypothetical protein